LTKNGENMAFVQLEDKNSTAEIIIFPKLYSKVEQFLNTHNAFIVKGTLDITSTTKCKIKANHFSPIDFFFENWPFIESVNIDFKNNISIEKINFLNNLFKKGKTKLNILFNENGKDLKIKSNNFY
jgi:DNA polymerase-3 subunit alpha